MRPVSSDISLKDLDQDVSYVMLKMLVLTAKLRGQRACLKDLLIANGSTPAEAETKITRYEVKAEEEIAAALAAAQSKDARQEGDLQ
jgi:hypothetical protein